MRQPVSAALLVSLIALSAFAADPAPGPKPDVPDLGAFQVADGERVISITLEDVFAYHGHPCPGATVTFRGMQLAARALWPDAVPQRDDIVIFSRGSMYGVLDVFALITQGPDLPKADAISQPSPVLEAMPVSPESYAFTVVRRSTGEAIHLRVKPTLYPKEFFPLRKKAVEETATPEERRQLKQHRAKVFEKVFRRSEAELFETPVRYRMLMFGA